jgi:hypothetical protein
MAAYNVADNIYTARHVIQRFVNPRYIIHVAAYDMASNIRQALQSPNAL